jgi:hypothetical protein
MQEITKGDSAGLGLQNITNADLQEIANPLVELRRPPRECGPSSMVRMRVMKRDRFRCTYCGVPGTDAELEVDHIIAVAAGGSHHMSNLTTACRQCNQTKGSGEALPTYIEQNRKTLPVGLFLLTFKNNGVDLQGYILDVDGDVCFVQLYSWLTGCPTEILPMKKPLIYSAECKLYPTRESWIDAAGAYNRQKNPDLYSDLQVLEFRR